MDVHRRTIETRPDGTVVSTSANVEVPDEQVETFDPVLRSTIGVQLDGLGLTWTTRALAGVVDAELTRLSEQLDAAMIIVGARRPGIGSRVRELMDGAVAAELTRHQHRPVVVVPHTLGRLDDLR